MTIKIKKTLALTIALALTATLFVGFNGTIYAADVSDLKIGDYVQIGRYQKAPIFWRVIELDKNGPVLLSDKILTNKDFNPKETNAPDVNGDNWAKRSGVSSNFWETSNLRAWLNATQKVMKWPRGYPSRKETPGDVYYEPEPGFLANKNFTWSDRNLIKSVKQKQVLTDIEKGMDTYGGTSVMIIINSVSQLGRNGGAPNYNWIHGGSLYNQQYAYDLTEKVFLLDVWQIDRIFDNDKLKTIKDDPYVFAEYAKASGLKGSGAEGDFQGYGRWYSRTPLVRHQDGVTVNGTHLLGLHGSPNWLYNDMKGLSSRAFWSGEDAGGGWNSNERSGIRPAFYLNTAKATIKSGSGTKNSPYVITGPPQTKLNAPTGLRLNLSAKKKTAKWKKVANNNGYILKVMQGKKQVLKINIKKGKTSHTFTKKQLKKFKRGKKYSFSLVTKGKGMYANSKAANSKASKMK